jgi:hypothetical protein
MADIVALPTAAAEPLPRKRWYGPYPKQGNVSPISNQRLKRRNDATERAEEAARRGAKQVGAAKSATEAVLRVLLVKAYRGELAGLLCVYQAADGPHSCMTGAFKDRAYAIETAQVLAASL